ncbi:Rad52/Rad22 family DNA repair protein [Lysinibacillus sp. CNPSo 3705]|uniref:Rad52/Rad22 family DNA repair protein n=1 Tax=Lysinibacillus sp. CNPSo 3705 TaxID=3028148 RepID=UPI002364647D|nr:Rad52/Rad22 family DNA repair protein [Lysinibacillus sp. CNPSo 3705]MDD1505532.1 Rad52/Rad22 family DNA repair protein [Lysinibacillus sp. CNPSo 3705]
MTGTDVLNKLAEPMQDNEIDWKVQTVTKDNYGKLKALIVPYVSARAIQSRLDKVCGLNWKNSYRELNIFDKPAIECTISIYHNDMWVSRSDAAEATQYESVKGGYSDALKRAAVHFGIGRFLYSLPQYWVEIYTTRPNGECEYVSGEYKINREKEYVKGYYLRPTLNLQQSNNQHSQSDSNPTNNPQRANLPIKKDKRTPDQFSYQEIQQEILECMNVLNIHPQHASNLFQYINCPPMALNSASQEQLQSLYEALYPVKMYVMVCIEQFKLPIQHQLGFASHYLKEQIGDYFQLIGRLDENGIRNIFENIRRSLQQQMA